MGHPKGSWVTFCRVKTHHRISRRNSKQPWKRLRRTEIMGRWTWSPISWWSTTLSNRNQLVDDIWVYYAYVYYIYICLYSWGFLQSTNWCLYEPRVPDDRSFGAQGGSHGYALLEPHPKISNTFMVHSYFDPFLLWGQSHLEFSCPPKNQHRSTRIQQLYSKISLIPNHPGWFILFSKISTMFWWYCPPKYSRDISMISSLNHHFLMADSPYFHGCFTICCWFNHHYLLLTLW